MMRDFASAMRYVRDNLRLRVVLVNPDSKNASPRNLSSAATYVKRLWKSHLRSSQFPDTLTDDVGTITKPAQLVTATRFPRQQEATLRLPSTYEDEEPLPSSSLARRRTTSMIRSPWFQSTVTARDVARILVMSPGM